MNYDQPRQRAHDKRWDYTTHNNSTGTHPIGYCQGWRERWDEHAGEPWVEKLREHKDKFHNDGHATPEEARECYRQYQLDHELFPMELADSQKRCKECGEWTSLAMRVGYGAGHMFILCEKHRNRETVEKHLQPGDSIHT